MPCQLHCVLISINRTFRFGLHQNPNQIKMTGRGCWDPNWRKQPETREARTLWGLSLASNRTVHLMKSLPMTDHKQTHRFSALPWSEPYPIYSCVPRPVLIAAKSTDQSSFIAMNWLVRELGFAESLGNDYQAAHESINNNEYTTWRFS